MIFEESWAAGQIVTAEMEELFLFFPIELLFHAYLIFTSFLLKLSKHNHLENIDNILFILFSDCSNTDLLKTNRLSF